MKRREGNGREGEDVTKGKRREEEDVKRREGEDVTRRGGENVKRREWKGRRRCEEKGRKEEDLEKKEGQEGKVKM